MFLGFLLCIICYYFSIEVKPSLEKEDRLPAVLEIWRNRFMGTPSKSPPLNPLKTPKLEMENSILRREKCVRKDALVSMHFQLLLFRVKITGRIFVSFFRLFQFCFKIIQFITVNCIDLYITERVSR